MADTEAAQDDGGQMPVTIDALRATGTQRVLLFTSDGSFDGRIDVDRLSDDAVVIMFAREGDSGEPLVVPIESIESIEPIGER